MRLVIASLSILLLRGGIQSNQLFQALRKFPYLPFRADGEPVERVAVGMVANAAIVNSKRQLIVFLDDFLCRASIGSVGIAKSAHLLLEAFFQEHFVHYNRLITPGH